MPRSATLALFAASVGLQWTQAARLSLKAEAERAEAERGEGDTAVAAPAASTAATSSEDQRDIEQAQECIDAVRTDGAGSVKFNFITMDGEVNANTVDRDMLSAGCFFEMALEAFNMYDEDGEDEEVQVYLNQGSSLRSQVNTDTLMRMLKFAHGKLVDADFVAKDVTFSEIEWPVKTDLTEANVSKKDSDFIESVAKDGKIFSLVIATHFMNFKELYRLCTAKVAALIFGKTEEEIREVLNQQG